MGNEGQVKKHTVTGLQKPDTGAGVIGVMASSVKFAKLNLAVYMGRAEVKESRHFHILSSVHEALCMAHSALEDYNAVTRNDNLLYPSDH